LRFPARPRGVPISPRTHARRALSPPARGWQAGAHFHSLRLSSLRWRWRTGYCGNDDHRGVTEWPADGNSPNVARGAQRPDVRGWRVVRSAVIILGTAFDF